MDRQLVASGSPFEATIGFSRAVRVANQVFVAGTAPIWPDGHVDPSPRVQTERCWEIALAALAEVGARPEHVVRTRLMVTSRDVIDEVTAAHGAVFADVRPACTTVIVAGFIDPRWVVEVELDAVVGE
jgi:enamine deaminase RidA (YjgF/YER057c/UK114 family)